MPPFNIISRRSTPEIVLSRKTFASKVENLIVVDILKYLYVITGELLTTEMEIAENHYLSLQYFTFFLSNRQ